MNRYFPHNKPASQMSAELSKNDITGDTMLRIENEPACSQFKNPDPLEATSKKHNPGAPNALEIAHI